MEWWQLIAALLGTSGAVELVKFMAERKRRKDAIDDRRYDAAAQLEELRSETAEQFGQIDERIDGMERKVDKVAEDMEAVTFTTKAQAYDRIRHLGMQYIRAGEISEEDLNALIVLHKGYKKLGGDGFLDKVMDEVDKLPFKAKKE